MIEFGIPISPSWDIIIIVVVSNHDGIGYNDDLSFCFGLAVVFADGFDTFD